MRWRLEGSRRTIFQPGLAAPEPEARETPNPKLERRAILSDIHPDKTFTQQSGFLPA